MSEPLVRGQAIELYLSDLAFGGEAVGRYEGKVVFVPYGIPGEKVKVEIVEVKKRYARARILEILEPSAERREPFCPFFGDCGGCQLQHLSYELQLKYKREFVEEAFSRLGHLDYPPIPPVVSGEREDGYRNRLFLHLLPDYRFAMHSFGGKELTPISSCRILLPLGNEALYLLSKVFESFSQKPNSLLKSLQMKVSQTLDEVSLLFVTEKAPFPADLERLIFEEMPFVVSLAQSYSRTALPGKSFKLIFGRERLAENILGHTFETSPLTFLQVNIGVAEALYAAALELLPLEGKNVIDAYCGAGVFSILAAERAESVIGIEKNRFAVEDARINAVVNERANVLFLRRDVERALPELEGDILVLNPPRSGCSQGVLSASLAFPLILYISCNPTTLARDLSFLTQNGFVIREIKTFDLFPQTFHVETLILLER